jgi:hypothetical protein
MAEPGSESARRTRQRHRGGSSRAGRAASGASALELPARSAASLGPSRGLIPSAALRQHRSAACPSALMRSDQSGQPQQARQARKRQTLLRRREPVAWTFMRTCESRPCPQFWPKNRAFRLRTGGPLGPNLRTASHARAQIRKVLNRESIRRKWSLRKGSET